jgi:hypothetical protein
MATQYVIPVGCDNFRKLVTATDQYGSKSLFVDKTKFIQEILSDAAEVLLITRPRRFGKTLNMSMLQHFLGAEVDGLPTKDLFNDLLISQDQAAMAYQGKYPVIFITFKDTKGSSYAAIEAAIREQIKSVYNEFRYLLDKQLISKEDQIVYQQILLKQSSVSDLMNSIKNLSQYIYANGDVHPYLLIDEYDTPIHSAYYQDYYTDVLDLIRAMLCTALKGNANIKQGILTGITRIAKESIFSGLNNLKTRSLLDNKYSTYFGFIEDEVNDLFSKSCLDCDLVQLKNWYNGYQCGDTLLYNPWSIMNSIDDGGTIKQYWINTSDNGLAIDLILKGGTKVHEQLAILLQGKTITESLDNHIVYNNIEQNRAAIWTLLVMAGYLKIIASHNVMDSIEYELALPNEEVKYFYKNIIQVWLSGDGSAKWYSNFLKDLLQVIYSYLNNN